MSIYKQTLPYRPLSVTPASRATDSLGSVDAEERNRKVIGGNQRLVLAGFAAHPGYTTKELAAVTLPKGWEPAAWRTEVGRRAKALSPIYLYRIEAPPGTPKGERELRWTPTEAGKRVAGEWG